MHAFFKRENGKVFLYLSEQFLSFYRGRILNGEQISSDWGGDPDAVFRRKQIRLEDMEFIHNRIKKIANSPKKMNMEGETLSSIKDEQAVIIFPGIDQNPIFAVSPKHLEELNGELLGMEVNRDWGLPIGKFDVKCVPTDWRGEEIFIAVEEAIRQYKRCNLVFTIYNLETGCKTIVPDLHTFLPANSGYIVECGKDESALCILHKNFTKMYEGTTMCGISVYSNFGWEATSIALDTPFDSLATKIKNPNWRGWWVKKEHVGKIIKDFNDSLVEEIL